MTVVSVSDFVKNTSYYIDNVVKSDASFTIKTKNGNAIIISESNYNSLLETIYLYSKKDLVEKIKDGEKEDIDFMNTYDVTENW